MLGKKFILFTIAVIGLFLAVCIVTGAETTDFTTDFMEGSFVGNIELENDSDNFASSYVDWDNGITYNISTVDDSNALMDMYYLEGVMDPVKKSYNGNDWNIYFTEAVEGDNPDETDEVMEIVICQSQGKNQGYIIYAIVDSDSDIVSSLDIHSEGFKNYVEPLLKTITLKKSNDVPKINEEFGLSEEEFQEKLDEIHELKKEEKSD